MNAITTWNGWEDNARVRIVAYLHSERLRSKNVKHFEACDLWHTLGDNQYIILAELPRMQVCDQLNRAIDIIRRKCRTIEDARVLYAMCPLKTSQVMERNPGSVNDAIRGLLVWVILDLLLIDRNIFPTKELPR